MRTPRRRRSITDQKSFGVRVATEGRTIRKAAATASTRALQQILSKSRRCGASRDSELILPERFNCRVALGSMKHIVGINGPRDESCCCEVFRGTIVAVLNEKMQAAVEFLRE
eukprot:GFKZ01005236.1.p1 GENE.GFKZ01005236.1~~GFKZ01005236.1.p1  ORF type:complete len:113 (-),score=5.43 GFKZ01005236.1:187-525(-)